MGRKQEKLSDHDKELIVDGLKEISGLLRDRPEVLGLALGLGAQASLSAHEAVNHEAGWAYSSGQWKHESGITADELAKAHAEYEVWKDDVIEYENAVVAYEKWQRQYEKWQKGELEGPLPPQPQVPPMPVEPANPDIPMPLRHGVLGRYFVTLMRNYGFVSPIYTNTSTMAAEAALLAGMGIQPLWAMSDIPGAVDKVLDDTQNALVDPQGIKDIYRSAYLGPLGYNISAVKFIYNLVKSR